MKPPIADVKPDGTFTITLMDLLRAILNYRVGDTAYVVDRQDYEKNKATWDRQT